MIYFQDMQYTIRNMLPGDDIIFAAEEQAQGWQYNIEKYNLRYRDQVAGKSIALIAEYDGNPAGYINLYPNSEQGPFARKGYPEIVDLGVLMKYRRRGIGNTLMEIAEQLAKKYADMVYLAVGLHSGYGSAQRLYARRGYLPDGSGVWYRGQVLPPYTKCKNDDDLVLYLSKKL